MWTQIRAGFTRALLHAPNSGRTSPSQETLSARERTLIVVELMPHFPLVGLLRTAGPPRSSVYDQQKALQAGEKHCELKLKIREIFNRAGGRLR